MNYEKNNNFNTVIPDSMFKNENRADAYGNFEATEIIISAQGNGELLKFDIVEGDKITEDQFLGQIDSTILSIKKQQVIDNIDVMSKKIQSLKFNLQALLSQKQLLDKEQKRITNLYNNKATTEQSLDKVNTELDVTKLKIKALEQEIDAAKIQKKALSNQLNEIIENLKNTTIINPVMGTILTKYKEPHELVSVGTPLYKIANLEDMQLKVYVSATQLDDIKLGQKVKVLIDSNIDEYHKFDGKIIWISASSEFTPKNIQTKEERIDQVYAVKVHVKNDGIIKIGMPAEVIF